MDAGEARAWLARRLSRTVPNDVWGSLVRHYHVEEVERGMDVALPALERFARELLAIRGSGRRRAPRLEPQQRIEDARSRALASFVAAEAAQEQPVHAFRQEILGGGVLSERQARAMLSSPAAQMFSIFKFRTHGVAPRRHRARQVRQGIRSDIYEAVVEIEGATWDFRRCVIQRGVPEKGVIYSSSSGLPDGDVTLQWGGGEVVCWRGSILSDLRTLSERLAKRFGWEESDVARFVVTGEPPPMPAIEAAVSVSIGSPQNMITLKVRPYVSPATVAQVYRELQAGFDLRPRRPLSVHNLEVLRFVSDETNRQGERPTFQHLMDAWNETHPNAQYAQKDYRNFWRNHERARRVIDAERLGVFGLRYVRHDLRKR